MSEMKKYRIEMTTNSVLLSEVFPRFVASKIAEGVSEKTENTYYSHWKCIGKHLDLNKTFDEITQDDINNVVVSMRRSGLAHNSISSYTRVLRTFLNWCRERGYTDVVMPPIKDKETVKETYTDEELKALLISATTKINLTFVAVQSALLNNKAIISTTISQILEPQLGVFYHLHMSKLAITAVLNQGAYKEPLNNMDRLIVHLTPSEK